MTGLSLDPNWITNFKAIAMIPKQLKTDNVVLQVFKKLHRTRLNTFKDDEHALEVTRNKINEEYRKHQNVTDATAIEELNKFAQEVEHEIRTTVIQAVEKEPGTFALRITPDITLLDNVPYKDIDEQCPANGSDVKTTSSEGKPK